MSDSFRAVPHNDPLAATIGQRKVMFALWKEAGVVDRETRLKVSSDMLGRVIESSLTLSRRDASIIIDSLLFEGPPTVTDSGDHDESAFADEDLF
jgi:hypothetical protein